MLQPPKLLQGPDPVETADLHFKLYCKLKAFEPNIMCEDGNCNLVAVSQRYGLIFVGNLTSFSVINTKSITPTTSYDEYPRREIKVSFKPIHIAVDNSQKILAVVCTSKPGSLLHMYTIESLSTEDVAVFRVVPLSKIVQNLAADAVELMWQPNPDSGLMVCMSDGSVVCLTQWRKGESGIPLTLSNSTQAMCLCWSPKGKQIVIGCANGVLSQYKPDLKLVKTLPSPPLFNGTVAVINVLWVSSYQFVVAYSDRSNPDLFPVFVIVNAAKNEPVSFINYDDITYSSIFFRHHQIYMFHQSAWNIIFVGSGNSMEVAVLHSKDNLNWEQWLLGDASRAELPLNADRQETFPLGIAFDYTSKDPVLWGEGTLPPMPRLLLLSDEGVLCIFKVVNTAKNVAQLCGPPTENFDDSLFVTKTSAPLLPEPPTFIQTSQNFAVQPSTAFGNSTPTSTFGSNASFGAFSAQAPSSVPEVTISISGGPVVGGVKDVLQQQLQLQQILLQQKQQQQQQQQQLQLQARPQVQQPQPQVQLQQQQQQLQLQARPQVQQPQPQVQQPQQQQPIVVCVIATNTSKATSSTPIFVTPPTPTFPFGMTNPTSNSFFGPKPSPTQVSAGYSIFNNKAAVQGDIFTGKTNLLQSTPVKQPEAAEKATTKPTPSLKKGEELGEPAGISEDSSGKGKSPSGSPLPGTPELAAVDDSVYWNALQEEIDHFNSELQQLSVRVGSLDIQVGTEEDKIGLRKRITSLHEFWKDLKETTASQCSEIHFVATDLMESFAWLEDAKSRNLQRKNPSFIELKKSEDLNPISARHMSDISHLKYYIENQIKQLSSHLVKEWMDHQDNYRMEVKNKMALPSLEEVYKTMHFQLKILNKQRALVQELREKLAAKKRKHKSQAAFISNSDQIFSNSQGTNRISELSKLADNLLQLKITRDENHSKMENWEIMKAQLKAIGDRSKKLSLSKQVTLRDVLTERDTVKIRPVKRTFESSFFVRSLPLEKSTLKTEKEKTKAKEKVKVSASPTKPKNLVSPEPKPEAKSKTKPEKIETQEKTLGKKSEAPKSVFVFGGGQPVEKSAISLTVQPVPNKTEDKSPLASLSGIVSSIGKESEAKPKPVTAFTFGTPKLQTPGAPQETFGFGAPVTKPQPKPEESKTMFNLSGNLFGMAKPSEPTFGSKTEAPKFGNKPTFGVVTVTSASSTSEPETTKAVSIASASANVVRTVATTSSPFAFSLTPQAMTPTMTLPKMNLLFGGKEQSSGFGTATTTTTTTTGNLFSTSAPQSSGVTFFGGATSIFSSSSSKPVYTSTTLFGVPKTTSETVAQPTGFTVTQPVENKGVVTTEASPEKPNNASPPKEVEVEVVKVEESVKKTEATPESTSKSSPKVTVAPNIVFGSGSASSSTKTVTETPVTSLSSSSSTTPPNVQVVSAAQSLVSSTTTSVLNKPVVPTTAETPTTSVIQSPATVTTAAVTATTSTPTSGGFSFSTSSPTVFSQKTAVTSIFGETPTTTSSLFGQVFPTTPTTTNIFGGGGTTPTTSTTNLFGASTPTSKLVFGQAAATSTPTSGSVFGGSTPTRSPASTFGQASTSTSSPSIFGQKPDAVAQTRSLFGHLLSDSNRSGSIFGTTSATSTTTANIFSTPKNIFGGASSTTAAPLFGTPTSSIFPQTSSLFGQPTTSSSIFGQPETSTSSSFFGQNICSPFGGGTSTTSNQSSFESGGFGSKPVFGQSLFSQTTSNTSIFGGSTSTPIFGTASTSPSSGGNVFQTPTTSTFGSNTSGPFSSGGGSVAETGFRAANSFQKPMGGFGSPPVFGGGPTSTPAFGASPAFSGSATFGSPPTFGARPGVFESSQGSFSQGQGQSHSTTFENLANQNTVGFGNLAQQSKGQGFGSGGFGGSPTFENKPVFGGNSFSSWRSK